MKKQISILGCGWLGLSLGSLLVKTGFRVKGSTTSEEKLDLLERTSIEGYNLRLNETGISGHYSKFLEVSETIIINIPPGLRKNPSKSHVQEIEHLITEIEKQHIKNVLFISSTSVFANESHFPIITNSMLPNASSNSAKQLIEIEKMLCNNINFNTTILRFGGLFDKDRHPAMYLSGRKNILNPKAPINLIHKMDCINIITEIIKNNFWNLKINASYPVHTDKILYYSNYCEKHHLPLPEFDLSVESKGKIIDSSHLVQLLNYKFKVEP